MPPSGFGSACSPSRQGAGKTGELLCFSATLISPMSDEGGWRLGVIICHELVANGVLLNNFVMDDMGLVAFQFT
jgi:hypothetical protein